jgi:hypothetical protein
VQRRRKIRQGAPPKVGETTQLMWRSGNFAGPKQGAGRESDAPV